MQSIDTVLFGIEAALWGVLAFRVLTTPARRAWVIAALGAGSTVAATVGLFQYGAIYPGTFPFSHPLGARLLESWQRGDLVNGLFTKLSQTDAPGSVFGHTNVAAEFVALTLPLLFGSAVRGVRDGLKLDRPLRLVAAALAVIALVIGALFVLRSNSRSALLALAVVGAAAWGIIAVRGLFGPPNFGSRTKHIAGHLIIVLILALTGFVVLKTTKGHPRHGQEQTDLWTRVASSFDQANTTVRERLDLWANSASMIRAHPVFGVGPGNFRIVYPEFANSVRRHETGRLTVSRQPEKPHNSYIEAVVENGWFGGVLWFLAVATTFCGGIVTALRSKRSNGEGPGAAGQHVAAIAVVLLCGAVAFPFLSSATRTVFWILAGALLAAAPPRPRGSAAPLSPRGRAALVVGLVFVGAVAATYYRAQWGASRSFLAAQRVGRVGALASGADPYFAVERLRALDQAAARSPADYGIALYRAETLRLDRRFEEAAAAFERAVFLHPNLINAWIGTSSVALERRRPAEAKASALRAVGINLDDPTARVHYAGCLAAEGDRSGALREYRNSLQLKPTPPTEVQIRVQMALLLDEARDVVESARQLRRAAEIAPGDVRVLEAEARIAERNYPGTSQAAAAWTTLLAGAPEHVEAKWRVGLVFLARGELEPALRFFDEAYESRPGTPIILYHRGEALARLGRLEQARASLHECMKLASSVARDEILWERARGLVETIEKAPGRPQSAPADRKETKS